MSDVKTKPLSEINAEAIRLLSRELGVANTARFIRQFSTGSGDYTEERREWVEDESLNDLLEQIRARRVQGNA
jgi:hypothetical protein